MSDAPLERSTALHPRTLAEVLLKVWAFTILIHALLSLPAFITQWWLMREQGREERMSAVVSASGFVQVALAVIAALVVLKLASTIASRLVGTTTAGDSPVIASPSWEVLAFGLLGTYFLVEGLRWTAQVIFQLISKPGYEMESMSYLWREAPEQLAGAIVMTIAGVILFAGRSGIAALWSRARGV